MNSAAAAPQSSCSVSCVLGATAAPPVLGFETAHGGDGDAGPASEALPLETKQRADGVVPLVFYHEHLSIRSE